MIETPCIKVCIIEPKSGLCEGCRRSLEEIARWGTYSDRERQDIMSELKQRVVPQTTK